MDRTAWTGLQRQELAMGLSVWLLVAPMCALLIGDWLAGVLVGLLGAAVFIAARRRRLSSLRERAAAATRDQWSVRLNDVEIGTISDADYATLQMRSHQDWRNHAAQLMNLGLVVARVVDVLLCAVPVVAFWALILAAVYWPETLADVVSQLRAASPQQLAAGASRLAQLLVLIGLVIFACNAAIGMRFGFVNRFSQDTARQLRIRLCTAAEGDLVLHRQDGGVMRVESV